MVFWRHFACTVILNWSLLLLLAAFSLGPTLFQAILWLVINLVVFSSTPVVASAALIWAYICRLEQQPLVLRMTVDHQAAALLRWCGRRGQSSSPWGVHRFTKLVISQMCNLLLYWGKELLVLISRSDWRRSASYWAFINVLLIKGNQLRGEVIQCIDLVARIRWQLLLLRLVKVYNHVWIVKSNVMILFFTMDDS